MCDVNFREMIELDVSLVKRNPNNSTNSSLQNNTSSSFAITNRQSSTQSSSNIGTNRSYSSASATQYGSNRPTQQTPRNTANNQDEDDGSNPTVCNCGQPAALLTVKKDGPNQGKQFYKCSQTPSACQFFLWLDNASNTSVGYSGGGGGGGSGSGSGGFSNNNSSGGFGNQRGFSNNKSPQNSRFDSSSTGNSGSTNCNCNEEAKL